MDTSDRVVDLLDQVDDRDSFFRFVDALIADREDEEEKQTTQPIDLCGRGPNGWENHSIAAFLEAALA